MTQHAQTPPSTAQAVARARFDALPAEYRRAAAELLPIATAWVDADSQHPDRAARKTAYLEAFAELVDRLGYAGARDVLAVTAMLDAAGLTPADLDTADLPPAPTAPPLPSDLVGSKTVCDVLGIDRSTLTRRVAAGEAPQPVGQLEGPAGAYIFARRDLERVAGAR